MKEYYEEIKKIPLLSPEEEKTATPEALIVHNLRLVVPIAKGYRNCGLPLSDLVQEGNIGLIEAANLYDPMQGRFSTFATYRIRHSIGRALSDYGRPIRLPANIAEFQTTVKNKANELFLTTGIPPAAEDIAAALAAPVEKVQKALDSDADFASLDTPIDENFSLGDMIAAPEPSTHSFDEQEVLRQVLSTLTPKEEQIIIHRFGLCGSHAETLEDAGRSIGVSRERARQLQSSALRKLRNPSRANLLKECFL